MQISTLFRDNLTFFILISLSTSAMYGYELRTYIHKNTHYLWKMSEGSLYPTLASLEKHGYITSSWKNGPKRKRKYYTLTEQGKNVLIEKVYDLQAFTSLLTSFPNFQDLISTVK